MVLNGRVRQPNESPPPLPADTGHRCGDRPGTVLRRWNNLFDRVDRLEPVWLTPNSRRPGDTEDPMTQSIAWDQVTRAHVLSAMEEYDQLGAKPFFLAHGFAPTTTYDLLWDQRRYPPKAILGTAYEFATGQRLASGDGEDGKTGAVRVLGKLGFVTQQRSALS